MDLLLTYLPPSIGVIIMVSAAGIMGLFKSVALGKKANDSTIESLQRQIDVLSRENETLRMHVEELKRAIHAN